jgi:hypothetical protein
MKMTTWAVLGALLVALVLAVRIAPVFSATPGQHVTRLQPNARTHAAQHTRPSASGSASAASAHRSYLVAARMGWAIG